MPRRVLLQNRALQIAFIRGSYPNGSLIGIASTDGTERTLVDAADLRVALPRYFSEVTVGAISLGCDRGIVLSIRTEHEATYDLFATGELRQSTGDGCPPSAHGGTTLSSNGDTLYARYGKTEKKLFSTEESMGKPHREWVTLSPDGKRVAFEIWPHYSPPPYGLQIMNTRTRQQLALARSLPKYWRKEDLAWSPDSQRIALSLRRPPYPEDFLGGVPRPPQWLKGVSEAVVVVDRRGVVAARIPNAAHPAWSPDGRMLAFDRIRGGVRQIYTANVDGSGIRQITHAGQASWSPVWR